MKFLQKCSTFNSYTPGDNFPIVHLAGNESVEISPGNSLLFVNIGENF